MGGLLWHGLILAAGRGPEDPMAKAYGVAHKCLLSVAGKSMLSRVVEALAETPLARPYILSIENGAPFVATLGSLAEAVAPATPGDSAPASALSAMRSLGKFPVLVTTGDHPLLSAAIIRYFMAKAEASGADVLAALATGDIIRAAYPETRRTYFKLGGTEVSGCNLFAVMNERGLRLVEAWRHIEMNRKRPLRLIAAFGPLPVMEYLVGRLTPERAFSRISRKLGIVAQPIFMPFAEAAIDVDKPDDLRLAERILAGRN